MARGLILVVVILTTFGCRLPPDRADLQLFDEKALAKLHYSDLYLRLRSQSALALEAFYTDAWTDLADAAKALEQTARFLPKAIDIPATHADLVPKESELLQKDAVALADAAREKNVRQMNDSLQRIQFNVRTLRPRLLLEPARE